MAMTASSTIGYQANIRDYEGDKAIPYGIVAQLTERADHAIDLINEMRGVAGRNADRLLGSEPINGSAVKEAAAPSGDISRLQQALESIVTAAEAAGYQVNRFSKL